MSVRVRKAGIITILEIEGHLTLGKACEELDGEFKTALDGGGRLFLLDMLKVPFVDSTGVGEVIRCHKRAIDQGGSIRIALQGKAHELFIFWKLNKLFQIFDNVESALASFVE